MKANRNVRRLKLARKDSPVDRRSQDKPSGAISRTHGDSELSEGGLVELAKIDGAPDAAIQSGSWTDYPLGSTDVNTSLPVGYVLIGILLEPPHIGRPVRILRLERNGVEVLGFFKSSPVTQLTANGFLTLNSVYRLRRLEA